MEPRPRPRLVPDFTDKERKQRERALKDASRFIRLAARVLPMPESRREHHEVPDDPTKIAIVESGVVMYHRQRCLSSTKTGELCKGFTLRGSERCYVHATPEELEAVGIDRKAQKRKSRVMHALDALVADELTAIEGVYLDALSATDPISGRPDHAVRMRAAEALLDRTQGKATSRTEISGPDGDAMSLEHLMASNPGEATDTE